MKNLVMSCCILVLSAAFAFAQNVPNKTDVNGKKQGFWEEKNSGGISKGNYTNDLKDGCWTNYSGDGKLIRIENFKQGVRDGVAVDIDQRGYLSSEAYYAKGLLDGPEKKYFYGLSPASLIDYKAGKINGKKKIFYENSNGKLMEESDYKDDMKDGASNFFTNTGDPIAEYHYVKNQLQGVQKTYFAGKKLQSEQEYSNNVENGFYREYHENGQLKIESSYLKGNLNGIYKEFSDKGKVLIEGIYVNGQKDGKWTEYDENGKVLKLTKFAKGKAL